MEWALWRRNTAGVCMWALPVLVWRLDVWQLVPLAGLAGALCLRLHGMTIRSSAAPGRIRPLTTAVGRVLQWAIVCRWRPKLARLSVEVRMSPRVIRWLSGVLIFASPVICVLIGSIPLAIMSGLIGVLALRGVWRASALATARGFGGLLRSAALHSPAADQAYGDQPPARQ